MSQFIVHGYIITYPIYISKVCSHLHHREHAQACCHCHQTGVNILMRGHLLIFDGDEPLQEGVSLVYLVCYESGDETNAFEPQLVD